MKGKNIKLGTLLVLFFTILATSVFAADLYPSLKKFKDLNTFKQEVIAQNGVVTSNHPLSSTAGAQILTKGGNAIDAIVASFFALSVVEPFTVSPFSAGFINLVTKTGEKVFIDNYTVAPQSATPTMFPICYPDDETKQAEGGGHCTTGNINSTGFKSIGVPGGCKAWLYALKHYGSGKLSLREILQPAIDYAKNGFSASPYLVNSITNSKNRCGSFDGWKQEFLVDGKVPKAGDIVKRPGFTVTLEALANAAPADSTFAQQLEEAGRLFYKGEIAKNVVEYIKANGGYVTTEDMAWYYGSGLDDVSISQGLRLRDPVIGDYHGYQIVGPAPTSSGGTLIVEMLNILEPLKLKKWGFGDPKTLFYIAEAMKIAWADRDAYMGDPDYAYQDTFCPYPPPPVEQMISKGYADRRRAEIKWPFPGDYEPGKFSFAGLNGSERVVVASKKPSTGAFEGINTTSATAIDIEGNIVAMTQTIHSTFGSCVILPGTVSGSGMQLNNTMQLFDPDPRCGYEQANGIGPHKRMLSSMSPTIILKDGSPFMAIGTPGGTRIFGTVMQGIINVIDHGMNIQQAVEAPRIFTMSRDLGPLEVEYGFPPEIETALENLGYTVSPVKFVAGCMNGIVLDRNTDLLHGGACWRRDGSAVGWSGGDALDSSLPYPPNWDTHK